MPIILYDYLTVSNDSKLNNKKDKQMIRILHANRDLFQDAIRYSRLKGQKLAQYLEEFRDQFSEVATVNTESLEEAYQLTNSIHDVWWSNIDVTLKDPSCCVKINDQWTKGLRSTSVGDLMILDDQMFMVADFGFEKVAVEVVS